MPGNGLEELFDRYRSAGDLDALARVFDRTAEQLLKVARHLSRDEAQAEDLVQATFLAAIEHAERFDASRPLIPWLTGILTNKAQLARSLAGRTPDPSRMAERAAEDPAHDTEIREFMSTLERALERVPDAYRQVLRIHLAEGKGAEEIAHEVKRPAGTVRVQLHRGLKRLRRLLPAGFALGGIALSPAPRGIGAVRSAVMQRAAVLTKAGVAGVSGGAIAGGLIMGKKVAAAVAVVLVASGALWVARRELAGSDKTAPQRQAPVELTRTETKPADTASSPPSGASSTAPANSRSTAEIPDACGALDVDCTWADGTPAAGVGVAAWSPGETHDYDDSRMEMTNEKGRASFEGLKEGKCYAYVLRNCHSNYKEVSIARGARAVQSIAIPAGQDMAGAVLDADGRPVARAEIWILRSPDEGGSVEASSSSDGSFFLRAMCPQFSMFATAERLGSSLTVGPKDFVPDRTGRMHVELKLLGECAALEGRVRGPDGKALARGWVTLSCKQSGHAGLAENWPWQWTMTDEKGEFVFRAAHKGPADVKLESPGLATAVKHVDLEEGRTTSVELTMDGGFSIEGTARGVDGSPIARAEISRRETLDGTFDRLQPHLSTKADAGGRFRLERLPPGETRIDAVLLTPTSGLRDSTVRTARAGETLTWDPVLKEGLKIVGRVVDEAGNPLEGWTVETGWLGKPLDHYPTGGKTDSEGRFTIVDCLDVAYIVAAYPPDGNRNAGVREMAVSPGPNELVLTVGKKDRADAFIVGRLVDDLGEPIGGAGVSAHDMKNQRGVSGKTKAEDGTFRVGPLPSGRYRVFIEPKDLPNILDVEPFDLPSSGTHDIGTYRLRRCGRLELVLHTRSGGQVESPFVVLTEEECIRPIETTDGTSFSLDRVYVGTYPLVVDGMHIACIQRDIEIRAGETTRLELTADEGIRQLIQFPVPEGASNPERLTVTIRSPDGSIRLTHEAFTNGRTGTRTFYKGLAVGRYAFEASSPEGWEARGSFEITDLNTETKPIEAPLHRRP